MAHTVFTGVDLGDPNGDRQVTYVLTPRRAGKTAELKKLLESVYQSNQDRSKTMSTVHVNREGEAKFIAAMTNEELLKTIQDFAQPLVEINKRIDVKEQPRSKLSKLSYGEPEKIDPDKYQSLMLMTQLKIAPYVIEASLRGAEGLRDVLKEVFGGREDRDESAPKPGRRNMTREQHRLVTQAAAMRGQDESLLALPAWVSQDGIDTPKAHEVIIDVDPED